jgi:hypothetical protein
MMLRLSFRHYIAVSILLAVAASAQAQRNGTPAEAKQMVQEALVHIKEVGLAAAVVDFNEPVGRWHRKEIYIFCYKMDGTCMCMGANKSLVGENLKDFKNQDGRRPVGLMLDMVNSKGEGWVDYQWLHPQTKRPQEKHAYVIKIPGYDGLIGAGVYR